MAAAKNSATPPMSPGSANSLLVEYLNAAVESIKQLREKSGELAKSGSEKTQEKLRVFATEVVEAIQKLQQHLHQGLHVEALRQSFQNAWVSAKKLRDEIEESYAGQAISRPLLQQVTSCQIALSQFQANLADKLNVERALGALREFEASAASLAADVRQSILDRSSRAIAAVSCLKKELAQRGVTATLKTQFEAAHVAVSELKQKIELPEHMQKIPEHVQTALTEKLETAHAFLSNFRERLGSISTLDVAIMALRDIAESAQAKGLEGKQRLLITLEQARQRIVVFQSELRNMKNIHLAREYYEQALEAVRSIELSELKEQVHKQGESLATGVQSMTTDNLQLIRDKVAFVQTCVEDTVVRSRESLNKHVALLNIDQALGSVNSIKENCASLKGSAEEKVVEKCREAGLLLRQLLASTNAESVKSLYSKVFEAIEQLRTALALSQKREEMVKYFSSAYESLSVASACEHFVLSAVELTVRTSLWADSKTNFLSFGKQLLDRARSLDNDRLGGQLQTRLLYPALGIGLKLDERFVKGNVKNIYENLRSGIEEGRNKRLAVAEGEVTTGDVEDATTGMETAEEAAEEAGPGVVEEAAVEETVAEETVVKETVVKEVTVEEVTVEKAIVEEETQQEGGADAESRPSQASSSEGFREGRPRPVKRNKRPERQRNKTNEVSVEDRAVVAGS